MSKVTMFFKEREAKIIYGREQLILNTSLLHSLLLKVHEQHPNAIMVTLDISAEIVVPLENQWTEEITS